MRFKKERRVTDNMNNIYHVRGFIAIVAFAMVFITGSTSAAEINIGLDKLSPQPVEPGQDFVLSITLANEGSDAKGVTIEIVPDSPIILKNDNDRVIDVGNIIKNGAVVETYQMHVSPQAVSGVYDIEFKARWLSNDQQREDNKIFKIMVRGVPQLVISNISINPELISPQDMFNITFSVSNEGTGIAREVQVSAATNDLPFVPAGADTKIIKVLNPGEVSQLDYRVLVKDKAEISSYSIPIKMEYKDENGTNISSQSLVGVRVLGKAELAIANIKTEPQNPVQGDPVTVTMRIENSGNGDAKSVKVSLNIPFEGTKTAFLGKIKPNDDAPAVFSIFANQSGDVPYSAVIEFEDDLGMHSITEALNLNVQNTNKSGFVSPLSAVVVVVGACVYYLYRRKK
ncbi:MAG: hypothetical protein FIB07_16800 [Candidatus Methanoperedens sp.]|nr:hypothetical protein [Candidatus Methanoperedens sp.]